MARGRRTFQHPAAIDFKTLLVAGAVFCAAFVGWNVVAEIWRREMVKAVLRESENTRIELKAMETNFQGEFDVEAYGETYYQPDEE